MTGKSYATFFMFKLCEVRIGFVLFVLFKHGNAILWIFTLANATHAIANFCFVQFFL